jgi:hypothetical protein
MRCGARSVSVIGVVALLCLGLLVPSADAQQIKIEGAFPRQFPRGQVTVVNLAVPSRDAIQTVEVSPSAGVKVVGIKPGQSFQGALTWSEVTFDVAPEAVPGDRSLVLVMPTGRSVPLTITIPPHVPGISGLEVTPAQSTVELRFAAVDASADLGDLPYVWFIFECGANPSVGVVRGHGFGETGKGVVRATVPRPSAPTSTTCYLRVRMTDSGGIESNSLTTMVDLRN